MANVLNQGDIPPGLIASVYEYSFAIDGGATGNHPMRLVSGPAIPVNAFVQGFAPHILATFTGGAGTTVAATLQTAGDLQTAALLATVGTTGQVASFWADVLGGGYVGIQLTNFAGVAIDTILTTAARTPTLAFAVNPVTAGGLRYFFYWTLSKP